MLKAFLAAGAGRPVSDSACWKTIIGLDKGPGNNITLPDMLISACERIDWSGVEGMPSD